MKITSLKKVYFLLATLFGLGGTVIGLGIAIHQIIMINRISDEEYLSSNDYYRYQCEEPAMPKVAGEQKPTTRDTETCIEEEKEKILDQRSYNSKENIIGGLTRGLIFLIVFSTHAHIFFKKD